MLILCSPACVLEASDVEVAVDGVVVYQVHPLARGAGPLCEGMGGVACPLVEC